MKNLKTISKRMYLATGERIWAYLSIVIIGVFVLKDAYSPVYIAPPVPREVRPYEIDAYYLRLETAYILMLYANFNRDSIEQKYRKLMAFMHPKLRREFEEKFFGPKGNIVRFRELGYEQVFDFDPDSIQVKGSTVSVRGLLEVYQNGRRVDSFPYCYSFDFVYVPPRLFRTDWGLLIRSISERRC